MSTDDIEEALLCAASGNTIVVWSRFDALAIQSAGEAEGWMLVVMPVKTGVWERDESGTMVRMPDSEAYLVFQPANRALLN